LIGHLRCIKLKGFNTLDCENCSSKKQKTSFTHNNKEAVNNALATQLMAQDFSRAIHSSKDNRELSPPKSKFEFSFNLCKGSPEDIGKKPTAD
jgi:hypothetical protein